MRAALVVIPRTACDPRVAALGQIGWESNYLPPPLLFVAVPFVVPPPAKAVKGPEVVMNVRIASAASADSIFRIMDSPPYQVPL